MDAPKEHNSRSHSSSIGSCSGGITGNATPIIKSEVAITSSSINTNKQDTVCAASSSPSVVASRQADGEEDTFDDHGDKVALLKGTDQVLDKDNTALVVQEQPSSILFKRKLSEDHSHFEEDSGTCVDNSNSSEIMLDNLVDKVQLTVSSVNSILPDLPEHDDDCEDKPLLPILSAAPQPPVPPPLPPNKDTCIPMVVLAATKRQHRMPIVQNKNNNSSNHNGTNGGGSSVGSSHHSSTESVKPSVLKKPKPPYSRQCSAPSTACSSLTPPVSEGSSRRDSGAEVEKPIVQVRKNREKSPCVSFDADIVYHVPEPSSNPAGGVGGVMRARSRSDASSRFKGKIAWLRDRRELLRSSTIAEDRESAVSRSNNAVSITPASAHRPRTRSDSRQGFVEN